MTPKTLQPASRPLTGTLEVPGDKSIAHRSVMFNAVADGTAVVQGLPAGEDVRSTIDAMKTLGARISEPADGVVEITGDPDLPGGRRDEVDCGNSGTTMRLLMGVLAGRPGEIRLVGDESLSRRPMERVAGPLRAMGAVISTTDGHAPVSVRGAELAPASHELSVASAQMKSALMLAALCAPGDTRIAEPGASRDHSERLFGAMGVPTETGEGSVTVRGPAVPNAVDIDVCGDASSAAFFAVAGAIVPGSHLTIERVGLNPTRIGFVEVLRRMGATVEIRESGTSGGEPYGSITVSASRLNAVSITERDVPGCIDELPVLAVAAAAAHGTTEISGAAELRVKESDRIRAVADMLRALGVRVDEHADGMSIGGAGEGGLRAGRIVTAGDHRIVMSGAVAALIAAGPVELDDIAPAAISFPEFFDTLARLTDDG